MGLAFVPIYIRLLGAEAYGLIGLFAMVQTWMALLDMGMIPALNREMARYTAGGHSAQSINDLLRSVELLCLGVASAIAIVCWFAAGPIASSWLQVQTLTPATAAHALGIMGFVLALRFCEGLYRGALFGLQRQVWYNVVSAGVATVRYGGAVLVLVFLSPTIQVFFLWQLLVSLASTFVLAALVHRYMPQIVGRPRFSIGTLRGVWKFAGGSFAIAALALLLTQADKVLLSRLLALEAFGYYMLAVTIASVIHMIIGPVCSAIYPRMVELSETRSMEQLSSTYHQLAQLVTILVVPATVTIAVFVNEILFLWSGDPQLAAASGPILSVYIIGSMLNAIMHPPAYLQLAAGWTSLSVYANAVGVVLLVPLIVLLVPKFGGLAAAAIWVVLNMGYVFIVVPLMHRRLLRDEAARWFLADVCGPSAMAVIIIGLGSFLITSATPNAGLFQAIGIALVLVTATLSAAIATRTGRTIFVTVLRRSLARRGDATSDVRT